MYAFPRPEHMEDFRKSSRGVRDAGPSESYGRAAIGSLRLATPAIQGPLQGKGFPKVSRVAPKFAPCLAAHLK